MARDDYYVIVYKILAYLYTQLKAGEKIDNEGLITNIRIIKVWGGEVSISIDNIQITPNGIDYLCNNNLMHKKDIKKTAISSS